MRCGAGPERPAIPHTDPTADRFSAGEFLAELGRHGLHIGDAWRTRIGGDYLLGVATRT